MNNHESELLLSADVEQQLDELLDTWAVHIQLSSQLEEEMNPHMFTISNELGNEWWYSLFNHFPLKNTGSLTSSSFSSYYVNRTG